MKDLSKSALSILSWPFALLLLAFTGYQTYTLIYAVTGSHLIAVIGLVLFEVGMLYWWAVFRNEAEGLPQMALSLLVFLACLSFVALATALKLGAVDAEVMGPSTPAKIITAAALIQLAAKLFFPLMHPDVLRAIKDKVQEGKLIQNAERRFEKRADEVADQIAGEMADEWTRRLTTAMNTKYHIGYQLGDSPGVTVIEGQTADNPTAAQSSWRDRLPWRKSAAADNAVSNNTQTETQPTTPTSGQGADIDALAAAVLARIQADATAPATAPVAHENGQRPNG